MNRLSSVVERSSLALVAAILLGTTAGSPVNSEPASARTDTGEALGLPSPETLASDLLNQFQDVYNRRDGEAYAAMFDRWVFSYQFSPLDKAWGAPDAWDYAHEVRTAQKMFADPKTTVVNLRLAEEDVSVASRADAIPVDLDGVWKVTAAVFLEVKRETADGRSESRYVRGQLHEFYFRRGTEDEGRAWRIVYWRDLTGREPLYTLRYR